MSGKGNKLISQYSRKEYGEEAAEVTKALSQGEDEFDGADKNSKKHARKRMRSTQRAQKRARQGNARRGQVIWPGMR